MRLLINRVSYYILAVFIIIAWVLIGQKVQTITNEVDVIKTYGDNSIISDSGLLWLVNKDNLLTCEYIPSNLVSHNGIFLQAPALFAYNEMLAAMNADGIYGLKLASAYRSYDYQKNLFSNRVDELISKGHTHIAAYELAAETIQPPGASEHQTGLALDVTIAGDLTQDFGNTSAGKWIAENAHNFGFIIRYPYAKTDITHITYEPWHLRYVGVPHAQIINDNDLTLEEYASFILYIGAYLVWKEPGLSLEYFVVIYNYDWPYNISREIGDISSIKPSDGVGYIITIKGSYKTY